MLMQRFVSDETMRKLGDWVKKHHAWHLSLGVGVGMDVAFFSIVQRYFPIKLPSDLWSSSVALGQAVYCVVAPVCAWRSWKVFKGMEKPSRYTGNFGADSTDWCQAFLYTPFLGVIVSAIPAFLSVAISASLGYIARCCLASRHLMAAGAAIVAGFSLMLARKVIRQRAQAAAEAAAREKRKREMIRLREEMREKSKRMKEQKEQAKEQAQKEREERMQAAKTDALAKFDSMAKDGKVERSHFQEALQPVARELLKNVPGEELLKQVLRGAALEEATNSFLPMIDVVCEEATHILDCDKFLELLFSLIDKDGNGSIEHSEMEGLIDELLRIIKDDNLSVAQQSITALAFRFADRNKDGKLDLFETQFLLDVLFQLSNFVVTSGLHVANAFVEAPLFEEEITKKMAPEAKEISNRQELIEGANGEPSLFEKRKKELKDTPPSQFWSRHSMCDPAVVRKGLVFISDIIMAIHHATDSSEGDLLTTVYLTANELLRGGIDEKSFVGMLAPMIKKRILAKPDLGEWKRALEAVKASQGGSWSIPQCEELEAKLVSAMENHWDTIQCTIAGYQENADELATNFSRALFELADIDCDGKISKREISIVKEFFNCLVTIALVMSLHHERVSEEPLPEAFKRKLEKLYPAAFAAVDDKDAYLVNMYVDSLFQIAVDAFDFIDKNADGNITSEELGGLTVKLLRISLRLLQCVWNAYLASATACSKDALKEMWERAEITEVTMESLPVVTAAVQAAIVS